MVDLNNKSQEDIELMFDRSSVLDAISLQVEYFYNRVEDIHLVPIRKVLNMHDVDDLMMYIISLLGNPDFGLADNPKNKLRHFDVYQLTLSIFRSKFMVSNFPVASERIALSLNVVGSLDTIFYDIVLTRRLIDDGQWVTVAQCAIGFDLDISEGVPPNVEHFRFPLIEDPIDWTTTTSGGYHTDNASPTLNLGSNDQPQQCLDVLNKLQHQRFRLTDNVGQQDLRNYMYTKMLTKHNKYDAHTITKNTTTSAGSSFTAMTNRDLMFAWRFDFRGRLYSIGYDINLQGDKYRKGTINPTNSNFKDITWI